MNKKTKQVTYDVDMLIDKSPKECKNLVSKIVSYKLKGVKNK